MVSACKKLIFRMMVLAMIYISMTCLVSASELRPLDIPDQRSFPQENSQESRQKVDESVYRDFELKIKNISHEKKQELIKTFTQKRDEAKKNDLQEELRYYRRLLEILSAN